MKQTTCADMGGPSDCTTIITGNTPEEMVDNGMKHMQEAHPEMAAKVNDMSDEDKKKWMDDFRAKYDDLPEAA